MTFRNPITAALLIAAAFGLEGCQEDNSIESGLTVHLAELHVSSRPGVTAVEATITPSSVLIEGGYDQANLEKHPIRDVNGRTLALYRAYLALDNLELVPCLSLSTLPQSLLNAFVPAAHAHAGHGSEPVGGRSLDKPNVIDIVTQEAFILPLGDEAIAPGRYCGVRASLVRLASEAYGKPEYVPASSDNPTTVPEIPEMAGRIFAIRGDYCAQTDGIGQCTRRVKVDVDDGGLTEPAPVTLDFDQPLELSATRRAAYLIVGIAHGEWAQNVDVTQLGSDAGELQKLLDNIAASIHIYEAGLGELPPNIIL